jgi:putative hydrolase of HD superfamily
MKAGEGLRQPDSMEFAQEAHDRLILLGDVTLRFAEVERAPRYADGHRETDVEHSFHLALSAVELAADYYPDLDVGLVAQFSLVHDLPEIYTGDVWTFGISDADLAKKAQAEKQATAKLLKELPPYLAQLLEHYEHQTEPEARFVRFVDKMLPAIINIMSGDANTFKEDYGITTLEEVREGRDARIAKFQAMFPEFPFIHMVRSLISVTSDKHMFPDN